MPVDLGDPIQIDGKCATVYGPVQSRRHGWSLGVNLGSPTKKICTWGCVYCQCGFGERRELVDEDGRPSRSAVVAQVKRALILNPSIDSVTLAGNCEPTQHPEFKEIVQDILELRSWHGNKWIFNALSNGSEFERKSVIEGCELLDEVWVKLDCSVDDQFRRLNRPVTRIGTVADHVGRIKKLKKVHIQSLFWKCSSVEELSNFNSENIEGLKKIFLEIRPAKIHLTTISRIPAFAALQPVDKAELEAFGNLLRSKGLIVETYV